MNKVVISKCYGGFGLSEKAALRFQELSGEVLRSLEVIPCFENPSGILWETEDIPRHHPALVQVVEELGKEADGKHASLDVITIPGTCYYITDEYGAEKIHYPESDFWIVIE